MTHDREMVDKMRRRVVRLHEGRIVSDEAAGLYADEESTTEFAVRMRSEMGVAEGHTNGESGSDRRADVAGQVLHPGGERALRRSAAPSVAAIVTIVVTVLLLGVLILCCRRPRVRPRRYASSSC